MNNPELVRSAQAGHAPAREALARQWLPVVHGVALAATRDGHAAEDVVQDAFAKAFSRLDSLREPARFGPWLLRIARNAATDRFRRAPRERHLPEPPEPGLEQPLPGESPVVDAWRDLPEDERVVCWLSVWVELPLREIAELLETSKSAVHRLHRRALARMREELGHVEV